MTKQLTEHWSSKWAFIIAATGAAVGLGNIWRFPYMAGMAGGSAFVCLYLIFVILLGLPIMIAEILIGKKAQQNPIDALASLARANHHTTHWRLLGFWGALALLLVLSFYSVVAGWCVAYLFYSLTGSFHQQTALQINLFWQHFLASPWELLAWHTLFMAMTVGVVMAGVQRGLERATKIMMPALYGILILLVLNALTLRGFGQAFHFLFDFRLSNVTTGAIVSAMGHAFFSLALGAGAMLAYGAYLPKRVNILNAVLIISSLDVLVALLSGLAIFPIVFTYHLQPGEGPGLMFEILPIAFGHMRAGVVVGGLFFILLIFAAWTSSINILEPMIMILMQKLNFSRKRAGLSVGFLAWVLGIFSILSFNLWKSVQFFHHLNLFDLITAIPMDLLLPVGGFGFAIFAGWVMNKTMTSTEFLGHRTVYHSWRFLVRYLAPAGIVVVFIYSLLSI